MSKNMIKRIEEMKRSIDPNIWDKSGKYIEITKKEFIKNIFKNIVKLIKYKNKTHLKLDDAFDDYVMFCKSSQRNYYAYQIEKELDRRENNKKGYVHFIDGYSAVLTYTIANEEAMRIVGIFTWDKVDDVLCKMRSLVGGILYPNGLMIREIFNGYVSIAYLGEEVMWIDVDSGGRFTRIDRKLAEAIAALICDMYSKKTIEIKEGIAENKDVILVEDISKEDKNVLENRVRILGNRIDGLKGVISNTYV